MSSFVVDFEVLPPDDPMEPPATEVVKDLGRQLHSRSGHLFRGDMARYFERATIVDDEMDLRSEARHGSQGAQSTRGRRSASSVHGAEPDGGFGDIVTQPHYEGHSGQGLHHLSNTELMDRISSREKQAQVHRQLAHTAAGDFGAPDARLEREMAAASTPHQRMEILERELRDAQEAQRADRARAQRAEQTLKDREQLLLHAKEMWMKESARASKLADALTVAQDRLTDQEKRLQELSDRYSDASQEVRQLRHLLDSPDAGGFGTGYVPNGMVPGSQVLGRAGVVPPHSQKGVPAMSTQDFGSPFPMNHQGGTFQEQQLQLQQAYPPGSAAFTSAPSSGNLHTPNFHTGPCVMHGVSDGAAQPGSYGGGLHSGSCNGQPLGTWTAGVNHSPNVGMQPAGQAGSSSIVVPPILEADTNTERFRHLCIANDAILSEDEMLQIGVKAEFQGLDGQIAVYFGNKANAALQAFSVQYFVREDNAVKLSVSSVGHQVEPMSQVMQRVSVKLVSPFSEPPAMRVQYLLPDASPRKITIRFPLVLTKFMRGRELSQQDFFRLWRDQHFVLNEVTSVCNLAPRLRSALVYIARVLASGGALRLHHGYDSNPDNFVLVGQLAGSLHSHAGYPGHPGNPSQDPNYPSSYGEAHGHGYDGYGNAMGDAPYGQSSYGGGGDTDKDIGLCLVRVEVGSGRFTGKVRIAVRSSDHTVAQGVCECILLQLTEPHSSGLDSQTAVMVR
mmetsp:Transcript_76005/g.180845  ORF Transcript_76005/g.180845 Transcript_76005/m.180845 type:complete len:731 (+) Transcript_76005:99-2291(+)